MYDITKRSTFDNIKRWLKDVQEHADDNVVIILVANKTDLGNARIISTDEGKELADRFGVPFLETSALNNVNITETFHTVISNILSQHPVSDPNGLRPDGLDFDSVADLAPGKDTRNSGCAC